MGHAALHHAVNGFFDVFKSKPAPAAQPASRAARVKIESRYNEDDEESLLESANSLPRQTLKALEKQLRTDGFKGAMVSGWNQGDRGGFTVHYGGEKYEFEISENVTPRPMGEIGRLVKESGRYQGNGRGIYHDMGLNKNDMVVHEDHRGRWRVDLITSATGNHITVGNAAGYNHAYDAGRAARVEHRKRGVRTGLLYRQQSDGNYGVFYWRGPNGLTARLQDQEIDGDLETNGRATTVDTDAARELDLYIANTFEMVAAPNSIGKSIDANLKRKLANGSYDSALAPKAWQYLVDEGAKRYQREFGSDSPIFNAATRRQVAEDFAAAWEEENQLTANQSGNDLNLTQAIKEAIGHNNRKQLEIWRAVSRRYPSTAYADFDRLMGRLEMDGVITLTGHRGPNTYKLA